MPLVRAILSSWIRGRLAAKNVPLLRSLLRSCVCYYQDRHVSSEAEKRDGSFVRGKMEALPSPKLLKMMDGIREGRRASLAEAITLVESTHPLKRLQAQWLLSEVILSRETGRGQGKLRPSFRIGLSGPPGAGKSTLIEALGQRLITQGHKVAVLAVDPSSSRSGGSILGDKTRMVSLARDPSAYIRPSPTGGSLGGVTRSTNEAILLCEGAGYDIIMVETVGVGQSEISVSDMVDAFVLVIPPASGDELQGIKRGIVEVSDIIVVNKADGDLLPASRRIKAEYLSAIKLARSKSRHWKTRVMMTSALNNEGVNELWNNLEEFIGAIQGANEFDAKREFQHKLWMWTHIDWELASRFRLEPDMKRHIQDMEGKVVEGRVTPGKAADILLNTFYQIINSNKTC